MTGWLSPEKPPRWFVWGYLLSMVAFMGFSVWIASKFLEL